MIAIILDGFVLLGLMYLFDHDNPNRDFLEMGLVAFLLIVASLLLNLVVPSSLAFAGLLPYFGLCILLLWKITGIQVGRALPIAALFVAFKVVEPYLFRALLGSAQ